MITQIAQMNTQIAQIKIPITQILTLKFSFLTCIV